MTTTTQHGHGHSHTDDPHDATPAGDVPARIRLIHDADPMSPREWSNLGTMYCEHRQYTLGDKGAADPRDDDGQLWPEIVAYLPLYLYDHSGITMRAGTPGGSNPFSDPWDSGCVGLIYVSWATVQREYGWKRITAKRRTQLETYLRGEVEVYDQYLRGDVYGFVIENWDGDAIDSCWGFYGDDPKVNGMLDHWDTATRELYARKGTEEIEYR